jgi:hypothetical protein
MADRIESIGISNKVEAFAKKRAAKRKTLVKEVQGKKRELKMQRKEFLKKIKRDRI